MFLPEGPFQFLLGRSRARHVNGEEELLEVNVAVLVGVEGAEHVVAELLGVARWEEHLVHVDKLDGGQSTIGAILLEAFVPFLDGILVVASVSAEELEIFLGKTLLALDASHGWSEVGWHKMRWSRFA